MYRPAKGLNSLYNNFRPPPGVHLLHLVHEHDPGGPSPMEDTKKMEVARAMATICCKDIEERALNYSKLYWNLSATLTPGR